MRKLLASLVFICFMAECLAQSITIIPQPKSLTQPKIAANFSISPATLIVMEGNSMEKGVRFFNDYLQQFYHFKLKVVQKTEVQSDPSQVYTA